LADIFAAVWVSTPAVFTGNVVVDCPAAIVTEPGTVAATLALVRVTVVPPGAAGPLKVIVAVEGVPPGTEVGFNPSELNVAGLTVSIDWVVCPLRVAEIVTAV